MKKLRAGIMVTVLMGLLIGNAQAADRRVVREIYFSVGRTDILPASRPVLREVAELLEADPDLKLRLAGTTCDLGSGEYNQALARRRTESARAYLLLEGIAGDRMRKISYGEDRLEYPIRTEDDRARNRRVVLTLDGPGAPASVALSRTATTSAATAKVNVSTDLNADRSTVSAAGPRRVLVTARATPARQPSPPGLLLDAGDRNSPRDLQDAVRQFLESAGPSDRFLMVSFDPTTRGVGLRDENRAAVLEQVNGLAGPSGMWLYDAIAAVSAGKPDVRSAPRHLVIFSAGVDEAPGDDGNRAGAATLDQAVSAANANGVRLLTVELGPPTAVGRQTLQNLARLTNGAFFAWDQYGPASQFAELHRRSGSGGQYEQ